MALYRVTRTTHGGKRIATRMTWSAKNDAQHYANITNEEIPGHNARVVKDSERIRKMIP